MIAAASNRRELRVEERPTFSRRGKVALAQFSVVKGVRDPDSLDTRNLFSRIARLSSFFLFNPSMRRKARIICRTKSRATVLSTRGHRGFLIMSRPWFTRLWKEPLVTSVNEGNPPGVLSLGDRTSGGQGIAISTLAEEIRALGHGVRYACGLGNYPFLPPPSWSWWKQRLYRFLSGILAHSGAILRVLYDIALFCVSSETRFWDVSWEKWKRGTIFYGMRLSLLIGSNEKGEAEWRKIVATNLEKILSKVRRRVGKEGREGKGR